jgi:predicted DNA-binding transcriptional regulator AlpA
MRLIDQAQQGVYRPGAWERDWLRQAFGSDWVEYLEPGDPYGRDGCEHIFRGPSEGEEQTRTMNNADPVLTAKEVAEELRCSKSQVYRLMRGNVEGVPMLPHLALGRKKVVPRSVLEQWKRRNISGMIRGDSETDTVDVTH